MSNGEPKRTPSRIPAGCWIGWLVAAIFCATTVWLAHDASYLRRRNNANSGQTAELQMRLKQTEQMAALLNSPDARHTVLTPTGGASPAGQVSWMTSQGALLFVANGLKPLGKAMTYELWLVPQQGSPIGAGLFRPDANGSATVELPPLPGNVQAREFVVTVEAAGGSPQPSKVVVMRGSGGSGISRE